MADAGPAEPTPTRLHLDGTDDAVELDDDATIGRSRKSDVVIDDASVSGTHARLFHRDGHWWVRDLASRNGTRLDGLPLPPGEDAPVHDGGCLQFGESDTVWRLVVGDRPGGGGNEGPTGDRDAATRRSQPTLSELSFEFRVSLDEEHASWSMSSSSGTTDLGDRSYVYLLVTLARERLADAERDVPLADRGWVIADDLAMKLDTTPETMKVHVYRARKQLKELGVIGGGGVVERRAVTNQIRFGSDAVSVVVGDDA
jgi:hypothetical protein